ncbi:MAG: hypothetical protein HY865_21515 [Chloroflexi bacterium]|nr:hypothetical protein [Chloroflexota bacterium]
MNSQPFQDNSKPKQRWDFGVSSTFMVFLSYTWASTIVQEWGQKPSQHFGLVCGIFLCFMAVLMSVDYALWRLQFTPAIRNGLLGAATLSPLATLVVWEKFAHPVWSQATGVASTVLLFAAFHGFYNWLNGRRSPHNKG